MKIRELEWEIVWPKPIDGMAQLRHIERCGRVCYKSEDKITDGSAAKFVKMLIKRGHHSVLEHVSFSVRFVVPRGISHEIVRHRLASYSQESTRYCDYSGDGVEFVRPWYVEEEPRLLYGWTQVMTNLDFAYSAARNEGLPPEQARGLLPLDLKTELVMTANAREWRHFFTLRTAKAAHPQMRIVACGLLADMRKAVPVLFDDIGVISADKGSPSRT